MRRREIFAGVGVLMGLFVGGEAWGQKPPLLPEKDVAALANEVSGETAKRNLEGIARFHRQRGSKGFHEAAELVAERLRAYGLSDVAILQFPADGKIFYGTQRSRPAWDAEVGELEVFAPAGHIPCEKGSSTIIRYCIGGPTILHESYAAQPVVLAEDSESGEKVATLVDVGEGTKDSDYAGKPVKDCFVLVSAQPGAVQDLAIGKYGAVGVISYAQNQKTAWSGEDQNLIRWGHLETFSSNKTLAFMISLKTARDLKARAAEGQGFLVHATVKAGQHAGNYEVVTATIPGADAKLKEEEIAFSCHLDHQRPGANDNASGCSAILEVARTLQRLIDEKKLGRPARTIRFIFPPEVEGTMALLNAEPGPYFLLVPNAEGKLEGRSPDPMHRNEVYRDHGPELRERIKAVIHMDMVGGGPETKVVFHVTRGPMSLPSFVHDVAWAFADWVNEESYQFAATGKAEYPMVAPEGGKEPLRAEYSAFTMGSDHDVYQDSSFGIPAIYMNDWPDRYIHTNFDSAANIDPTKLKRAAFIGAASGYFLANSAGMNLAALAGPLRAGEIDRQRESWRRRRSLSEEDAHYMAVQDLLYLSRVVLSTKSFLGASEEDARFHSEFLAMYPWRREEEALSNGPYNRQRDIRSLIFTRRPQPKGPLAVFGYDYFAEHAKAVGIETPKLLSYQGLWGGGEEYAYEVLNFVDGMHSAELIRDEVSAEYGPVPLEMVVEYLKALEKIGIVEEVKK